MSPVRYILSSTAVSRDTHSHLPSPTYMYACVSLNWEQNMSPETAHITEYKLK